MEIWIKAFHVISVIAWMAGIFYLPRLYVYHATATPGSETTRMLEVMERKLLKIIMNPAMIAAWVFGVWAAVQGGYYLDGWFHAKLLLVIAMTAFHGVLGKWRKDFANASNSRPERFYRLANEVPTVLMILIVILAVVRPF